MKKLIYVLFLFLLYPSHFRDILLEYCVKNTKDKQASMNVVILLEAAKMVGLESIVSA